MPKVSNFVKVDIKKEIEELRKNDPEFRELWDNSRMEYELLGQLTKLRNQKGYTQKKLAEKMGKKQQTISKMENKEKSPTLKTLCSLAKELEFDIVFVPRQATQSQHT